jgi:hypothetical protein
MVLMSEGYLSLDNEKSMKLFIELTESGLLWERLSIIFNDYANGEDDISSIQNKLSAMAEMQGAMMKQMGGLLSAPKFSENNIINEVSAGVEVKDVIPEPVVVSEKIALPKKNSKGKKGLGNIASAFTKFK